MNVDRIKGVRCRGMGVGRSRALDRRERPWRSILIVRDGKIVEIPPQDIAVSEDFTIPVRWQAR